MTCNCNCDCKQKHYSRQETAWTVWFAWRPVRVYRSNWTPLNLTNDVRQWRWFSYVQRKTVSYHAPRQEIPISTNFYRDVA
jgi:hypothetical protein